MYANQSTEEEPRYSYRQETGTPAFMVICDEGWRQTVVCSGMYKWAAEWLVGQLQGKPYAPGLRP